MAFTNGLVHISTNTFSSVSTLTIDGVFSSTYDNYKILLDCTSTTDQPLFSRLRSGGSADTNTYYEQYVYGYQTTFAAARASSTDFHVLSVDNGEGNFGVITIGDIAKAAPTMIVAWQYRSDGDALFISNTARQLASNAYDGIQFANITGNITGKYSVFGYVKS